MVTDPPTNPFQVALMNRCGTPCRNDAPSTRQLACGCTIKLQQFEEAISQDPDIIFFLPLAPDSTLDARRWLMQVSVVIFQVPVDSEHAVSVSLNPVLQAAETGASVFVQWVENHPAGARCPGNPLTPCHYGL